MKPIFIINDLHLSAIRSGGTTPQSALALRQHLLRGFENLLDRCDSDVLINGDFADDYRMLSADMLEAYWIICRWLTRGHTMYALPGNHCLSKDSQNLSSFEFLFRMLEAQYPDQIHLQMTPGPLRDGMYAVPHVLNQATLGAEVENLPVSSYAFFHANYENFFAINSDHSLNISEAQAKAMPVKHAIFGHVHQASRYLNDKVILVGNQVCSSLSDCLGNSEKFMLKISDAGIEHVSVWKAADEYLEVDWKDLDTLQLAPSFVRAVGTATSLQAAEVIAAISRYRSRSNSLIVGNAVAIQGMDDMEMISASLEDLQGFSVLEALLEILTPEEGVKIKKLLEKQSA